MTKLLLQAPSEILYISYFVSRVFYSYLKKSCYTDMSGLVTNLYPFQNVLPRDPVCEASLSGRVGTNV